MRIIPKESKIKLTFYKGITIPDIVIGFFASLLIAITLSSNFQFRWYFAIGILCLTITLYISFSGERLYQIIGFVFKYLASRKKYTIDNKNDQADMTAIIPYKEIEENFIVNRDDSFVGVLEICPIDFRLLSNEKQDYYIENVLARALNHFNISEQFSIVKIERPLILDCYIQEELNRMEELIQAKENGDLTQNEWQQRMDIIQNRLELIDAMNSEKPLQYSCYYLCLIGKNKNDINFSLNHILSILNHGGIQAKRLNNQNLVAFIRYSLDGEFDERELDSASAYKNYLMPETIQFTLMSTKQKEKTLSHFIINHYPSRIENGWGEGLFDMENTKVVMKLVPIEKCKAIKRIDHAILELQTQAQKDKASVHIAKSAHLESLQDLLISIQNDNETLFDTTVLITVYDEIGQTVNKKKVRTRLREMGFGFTEMLGRQQDAYLASNLSMLNKTNISRGIQTTSIAACFPFVSNAVMDKKGLLIGENKLPVFIDFFKRDDEYVNSNMVIIGKPGSGKSYATKTILCHLCASNSKLFVLDPENEYGILAENLGGKSIDLASGLHGKLNPFHIIASLEDGEENNSFYAHLQFLEQFYRLILTGIHSDSLELLNRITQELYERKGIDAKTDLIKLKSTDYPTFDDLNQLIEEKLSLETDDYSKTCLKILINYVSKFKTGGRNSNLWNGYTTFSPQENFIAFNFQKLLANKNDVTANAQMLLVLKWLENEIIKNRDYNTKFKTKRKIVVVVDECHLFIDEKYPIALDFMFQLAKRIRKYEGMLIIITQNVKDFAGTPEIARKSSAIINVSQYSLIFALSPNDMTELCKLYENAGSINEYEKNSIVHNPRGSAFLISSPNKRTNIDIVATDFIEKMFG